MRIATNALWFATCAVAGVLAAFFISWTLIYGLLFGAPCAGGAHDHELGTISQYFFETSSATGYHPEPNKTNWLLTGSLGFLLGIFGCSLTMKRNRKRGERIVKF